MQKLHCGKRMLALCLFLALIVGEGVPGKAAEVKTVTAEEPGDSGKTEETGEPEATEEPAVTEEPEESPMPTATPVDTPMPTAVPEGYVLTNEGAKYYKGGQTGIHYQKVKGKKIYHIVSYTTDTVQLSMSHKSTFTVYGGGSKKEVRKKLVSVSAGGVVRCHQKGKGETLYTIIQAESKVTGEKQYIYIYFKRKVFCENGNRITLYEKHSERLRFDYARKNLSISIENKKKAKLNKKGDVIGIKKGTTYVTAKVKGSENNEIRIKIVVKEEPWLVNDKDRVYDYNDLTNDLHALRKKYPSQTGLSSLGKSWDGRDIWCLRIGSASAPRQLVIDAAIHAREWKNTQLAMRQAEDMLRDYSEYRERFRQVCIYVIPMANPDGVSLAQYGASVIRNEKLRKRCEKIGNFSIWKNNARGVNLNYNFPSGFSKKRKSKKPDYLSYPGKKAGSEKETKALMKFFKKVNPDASLNLHSTGSVLYWDFNVSGERYRRQYYLASKVHSFNGYRMMPKSGGTNANGGLADWLVYNREITSVTVETGTVRCPLPHSQFASIYKKNNKMLRWFMTKY